MGRWDLHEALVANRGVCDSGSSARHEQATPFSSANMSAPAHRIQYFHAAVPGDVVDILCSSNIGTFTKVE
jgi:hypothetical protein